MALEGVMLYLMLVKVFHTKTAPAKSKKIFFCLGWGLPVIIVVTSGVLFHEGYGTPAYCWLSLERGFIWSFVGPVLLVLAFNFVFLGITFNVMAKSGPASNKKRTGRIRRWSKACMLLTCILGLTWMFGVFYINQESLFMAYFFTIFNTLQFGRLFNRTIETKRNTFVVHVSDGQVRVRGVATDEHNRNLQNRDNIRHSTASAASEESENEQRNKGNEQETPAGPN
ncbi:hypothetical protein OS493_021884 [Desmophyllum pertusum]|uniref:G-protein coupled receptors family 2 profile 2 domain-containing protein n=1 Tax=Desmophyllum pertusum TaxID=174260 RepID=A0A9X0CWY6_9CNID|nr:hypothetical protein OS493_021884 [Desmophyllum pertusum]